MESLRNALTQDTVDDAVAIISRRLAGDHLDAPFSTQTDEAPREALVQVWRDPANKQRFGEALQALIQTEVLRRLKAPLQSARTATHVAWLTEFFGLALTSAWQSGRLPSFV